MSFEYDDPIEPDYCNDEEMTDDEIADMQEEYDREHDIGLDGIM